MHLLHSGIAERAIVHLQQKPRFDPESANKVFQDNVESR